MYVAYDGHDHPSLATATSAGYGEGEHEPARSIARHLHQGGRAVVLSLSRRWEEGDTLLKALQAAARGERPVESLGQVMVEATYDTLGAFLEAGEC
ncbi:hypothetical protein D9600_13085 [Deinococcus sp. DB0503]|nr:hypothetical protein [Deinococcus sp. DB0503]